MISKLHAIYEDYRLYRANPCDVGAHPILHPILHPIQRGLIALATDCPCCNGARIIAVAIAAAVAPLYALSFLAGVIIAGAFDHSSEEDHEEV